MPRKEDTSADRPMVADDLVRLDNDDEGIDRVAEGEPGSRRIYLSSISEAARLDVTPEVVDGVLQMDLPADAVVGRLGEAAEAVTPAELADLQTSDLPAHRPEGAGITYHPKLASPHPRAILRRRNGKAVTPHYVFGADDRQVFVPSGYPWRCIGKVFAWTNPSGAPAWAGTGALVGRNVVLTASHVCPWGASPWMMQFIPAFWDGVSYGGTGLSSYVQTYRGYRDHDQGDDMAVLKLYTPLGADIGYFGYKTYDDDWEDGNYWTKVGYPGAVASGSRPSRIQWYPIVDDDNDGAGVELEYKADASDGDSGGPVFGWWSGAPYVIGTHSGGEEEYEFPWNTVKNNVAAGGSALSSLINWARTNW